MKLTIIEKLILKKILLVIFLFNFFDLNQSISICSNELEKCTSTVNPLLRNISYMFPISKDEVMKMCSKWSNIVDCVRNYVKICFNKQRKQTFNLAVESSIGTVHSICSFDSVQKEYLLNAACFRNVSIKNCKFYYNQLVDIVANGQMHDNRICCAYARFRNCVDVPLTAQCGQTVRNLMDHSFAFLIQKCKTNLNDEQQNLIEQCPLPVYFSLERKLDNQHSPSNLNLNTDNFYSINGQTNELYSNLKENLKPNLDGQDHFSKLDSNLNSNLNQDTDQIDVLIETDESNRNNKNSILNGEEFHLNQKTPSTFQESDFDLDKTFDSTETPENMRFQFLPENLNNSSNYLKFNLNEFILKQILNTILLKLFLNKFI